MEFKALLMDETAMLRALVRISHQILENSENDEDFCLVGIKTRGVSLARRIAANIEKINGRKCDVGILDITLYRDDLSEKSRDAVVNGTDIPFSIDKRNVILVDDVIYTGRTIRAALDALFALGRARRIQLVALIDRGHRELPIRPDYIGKNIPTSSREVVAVNTVEDDGKDGVVLLQN